MSRSELERALAALEAASTSNATAGDAEAAREDVLRYLERGVGVRQVRDALLGDGVPFRWRLDGWQGHFRNGQAFNSDAAGVVGNDRWGDNWLKRQVYQVFGLSMLSRTFDDEQQAAVIAEGDLPAPIVLGSTYSLQCPYCDTELVVAYDGAFRFVAEPCPHPDGLATTKVELNVPSGQLFVANDLRQWFPIKGEDEFDIGRVIGMHRTTVAAAEGGMAHGFVGNSCPGVYREGTRLVVGGWPDEIPDPDKPDSYDYIPNPEACPWGERVAGVTTDLWWYSIVDFAEFKRRFAYYTPEEDFDAYVRDRGQVVDTPPGVYLLRHRHKDGRDGDDESTLFATLEWLREPDPLRDWISEAAQQRYTAMECIAQRLLSHPEFYLPLHQGREPGRKMWAELTTDEQLAAIARVADSDMFRQEDWHENGFPRREVTAQATRFARDFAEEHGVPFGVVPPLAQAADRADPPWRWYPIWEGTGAFCRGAGMIRRTCEAQPLNSSYRLLALNIAQCMLTRLEEPVLNTQVYPPTFMRDATQQRLRLVLSVYRSYRAMYPDLVMDEVFDSWALSEDADGAIDEGFDFGPAHPPEDQWPPRPRAFELADLGGFIEFDSRLLPERRGRWTHHPSNVKLRGYSAHRDLAARFVLHSLTFESAGAEGRWQANGRETVPLHFVARIVPGPGRGTPVLEVKFDFGTPAMTRVDSEAVRWAIPEELLSDKTSAAWRHFTDVAEYERLLAVCEAEFEASEAAHTKDGT